MLSESTEYTRSVQRSVLATFGGEFSIGATTKPAQSKHVCAAAKAKSRQQVVAAAATATVAAATARFF